MTFAEAFREMRAIAAAIGDDACIRVESWAYADETSRLTWQVWSSRARRHFDGSSASEAVGAYRVAARDLEPGATIDDALEAVGACEVAP